MAFEFNFTFVNNFDMSGIFMFIKEPLATISTLEIDDFFMNFLLVTFQRIIENKGFWTQITLIFFGSCGIDSVKMPLQNVSIQKSLVTKLAFEIFLLSKLV